MPFLRTLQIAVAGFAALAAATAAPDSAAMQKTYGLVIHGGAGVILRKDMTPELEAQYRAKLQESLDAGYAVLDRGGPALDAVVAAIKVLEDSPLFNAGHGAVLNADGLCELDASIMEGRTRAAGAVAGVQHIRNPITLARDVMEKSEHVMLAGKGAERFAEKLGYELVPNEYFQTERRRKQLERAKALESKGGDLDKARQSQQERVSFITVDDNDDAGLDPLVTERKFGTVGCVALDQHGNLAAGTSTGGMTNKKFGRVGDSPIIGAGTYADNGTCALSATGHGEFFIRTAVGKDVSAQMEYAGRSLSAAAQTTITKVGALGGTGGVIAIDAHGNITMPFNTPGMYRGFKKSNGDNAVALYGDET
ncbi:MAG TPA: isoaspartyl peptidase/L-asparaginase [Opitutaceae bacterium]